MNIAFIPVRGGSKSIPLKNIKDMNGKPLVYWTVKAACESRFIDRVYVSTDSEEIKNTVASFGFKKVIIVGRSPETACDTASTESAMLEFADKYDFDNIMLIQATSPLLKSEDIDGGFELFKSHDCDSVISVVRQHRFIWKNDEKGCVFPINYDVYNRPRRQDFDGCLMENGAFYITSKNDLLKSKNRVSGKIKAYEMPENTAYEIDEPEDWTVVEQLMRCEQKRNYEIKKIKMFLTDCDGCLTDGGMYYSEKGDEMKKFNTLDGVAFAKLKENGIITGIITGENVELNRRRAEKIKVDELYMGVTDKLSAVKQLAEKYNISLDEILYVGDDINDLPVLREVGFPCCPKNAQRQIKETAVFVSECCGGFGVIRNIADILFQDK